jgi:hypothetical protein
MLHRSDVTRDVFDEGGKLWMLPLIGFERLLFFHEQNREQSSPREGSHRDA